MVVTKAILVGVARFMAESSKASRILALSVAMLAERLKDRRQAFSIAGSLLVHAGLAIALLSPAPSRLASSPSQRAAASERAVSISLVRSITVATADTHPDATPSADALSPASPVRNSTAGYFEGSGRKSGQSDSVASTPSSAAVGDMAAPAPALAEENPTLSSDYQRRLLAHIEPFKRYPELANRGGVRGTVQLVFQLDRDGRVLGLWVAKSSGSDLLDMAAIDTVRRATPLPPIPAGLPDAIAVQLPVEFSGPG